MDMILSAQLIFKDHSYDCQQVFQLATAIRQRLSLIRFNRKVRNVVISVNNPYYFLASFVACQWEGCEIVIAEHPLLHRQGDSIFNAGSVDCWIAERKLIDGVSTSIPQLFAEECTPSNAGEFEPSFSVAHLFRIHEVSADEVVVAPDRWQNTMAELDVIFEPATGDTFLIDANTPFGARVVNLLWGFLRGLKMIVDSHVGNLLSHVSFPPELQMDFSLFYFGSPEDGDVASNKYKMLLETVQYADKNHFSAVWTPERHFNHFGGLFPNPSVLSAALAVSTSELQIRCGSIVSPLHHAVRIAEDWSVIDNLSGGRAAISFASGWQCDDFVFFPERYKDRHNVMLEQIATVRKLWKGESVSMQNGLGKEILVGIYPKPVQQELPVWVTVSGKTESFIDAGKIGANVLTHLLWQDTSELIEKIAAYRQALETAGYHPRSRKVAVMAHTFLGVDLNQVRKQVEIPLKNYIRSSVHLIETMSRTNNAGDHQSAIGRYGNVTEQIPPHLLEQLLDIAFERFFANAGLLGTEETCHKMVRKLKAYDVDEVACLIDFHSDPKSVQETLRHLNNIRQYYRPPQGASKVFAYLAPVSYQAISAVDDWNQKFSGLTAVAIHDNLHGIAGSKALEWNDKIPQKYYVRYAELDSHPSSAVLNGFLWEPFNLGGVHDEKFVTEISNDF